MQSQQNRPFLLQIRQWIVLKVMVEWGRMKKKWSWKDVPLCSVSLENNPTRGSFSYFLTRFMLCPTSPVVSISIFTSLLSPASPFSPCPPCTMAFCLFFDLLTVQLTKRQKGSLLSVCCFVVLCLLENASKNNISWRSSWAFPVWV